MPEEMTTPMVTTPVNQCPTVTVELNIDNQAVRFNHRHCPHPWDPTALAALNHIYSVGHVSTLSIIVTRGFNSVILPLAKAPAPWSSVHSFQIQQSPKSPQTRPLQSPGSPLHFLIWFHFQLICSTWLPLNGNIFFAIESITQLQHNAKLLTLITLSNTVFPLLCLHQTWVKCFHILYILHHFGHYSAPHTP